MRKLQAIIVTVGGLLVALWGLRVAGDVQSIRVRQSDIDQQVVDLLALLGAVQAAGPTQNAQERIIDLPEDGHTWHTILFLRPGWQSQPAERKAHTIFFTETGLISLRQQTHWHVITTDQPEFEPFRALVNITPCLVIERANGEVIYRESGPQLGRDNDGLRRAIRREVERHCPDGRCLPLHPVPGPDAPRVPDEIPAVLREEPPPAEPGRSPAATLLAGLAGLAGGAAANWRKNG